MPPRYRINDPDLTHNDFDGEVVIVHFGTGSYYSLRDSAAAIWAALRQGPASAEELAALCDAPPPDAGERISAFLASLEVAGLVAAADGPAPADRPRLGAYADPVLEAFDELQELLLADVIHDADEDGWPSLEGAA